MTERTAIGVADVAAALQVGEEVSATKVAQVASDAAERVAASVTLGGEGASCLGGCSGGDGRLNRHERSASLAGVA